MKIPLKSFLFAALTLVIHANASPMTTHSGKVACVGDSITAGVWAAHDKSYPSQLQDLLGKHWEVQNFGVSGTTMLRKGDCPYWKQAKLQEAQDFQPDAIILLLGANDSKPQNWAHATEFPSDYADMVKIFQALPSHPHIYICHPCPVPDPGNFGINEEAVLQQITMIDKIAADLKVDVIDFHTAMLKQPELFGDRVHPNARGYTVMAATAYHALTGKKARPSQK